MRDEANHSACVDAWLDRIVEDARAGDLLALFENALRGLLNRTKLTLGEVTLTAIADRIIHTAAERFPMFAALEVESTGGIRCQPLRDQVDSIPAGSLREGVRFVLIEYLTVLGNLTAEILTPELHAELAKVDQGETTS